ncbi:hypothetical protein [Deinococcus sp. YIM 77859]|uniref:hypothetical protein n=1 Tax=Deinococcus sp. YIM 77859 TaxID=1540221 RepID=UPI00055356C9|nr:hypothetical protein [Deinococcus sp. YIM 77859]
MAEIKFRNERDGSEYQMTHPRAARVLADVQAWADKNGFEHLTFWRDQEDEHKLWVQLGEDRLNYWMHDSTFTEGRSETVEMQLDYARGAQRRSAAGYDKFDR